ncbi:anti-sigma factor family protein [Thermodesulfobacteriota bacterium]
MRENHIHKDCLELFEKLSDYIDNELAPEAYNRIKKHVGECLRCKICVETLKRTVALCHHLEREPVPDSLSKRLETLIQQMPAQE